MNNYNVHEGRFSIADISQAEEVFITNSIMGIMKVKSIGEFTYGESCTGDQIRNKYENDINDFMFEFK